MIFNRFFFFYLQNYKLKKNLEVDENNNLQQKLQ